MERSVQLDPKDPQAHSNLGVALQERGKIAMLWLTSTWVVR